MRVLGFHAAPCVGCSGVCSALSSLFVFLRRLLSGPVLLMINNPHCVCAMRLPRKHDSVPLMLMRSFLW